MLRRLLELRMMIPPMPTRWAARVTRSSAAPGGLLKIGIAALLLNEIRGIILAAPVLYRIYDEGGTWAALWIGLCSLAGIGISLAVPLFIAGRVGQLRTCAA